MLQTRTERTTKKHLCVKKKKKYGTLGLTIDIRALDSKFSSPPGVEPIIGEGCSRTKLDVNDLDNIVDVAMGTTDVKDCFYRLKARTAFAQYSCAPTSEDWRLQCCGRCLVTDKI